MKHLVKHDQAVFIFVLTLCLAGASSALALTPAHLWSQRFGGSPYDCGYAVAADNSSNLLVTGFFSGTVNFGGGDLTSAGGPSIFLAKFDPAGVHQWSRSFGRGYGFGAADDSNNVLVSGSFLGTANFGGSDLTSAGDYDIFIAKYNADGVHQWSQRFGNTDIDHGFSIAVDGSGNVLVTGSFSGTVDFGGGALTSAGVGDLFIAKYSATGVHQWSRRFGSVSADGGNGVAADSSGNVLVTGFFHGTVNFGGDNLVSAGSSDIFVAKYGANGGHQWSQRFGSSSEDDGSAVAVDTSGNLLVTGTFTRTVSFGGNNLASAGSFDIFVAKYNAAGVHQWSQRFGSVSSEYRSNVTVDGSGNVLLTGEFYDTVNFGGGALTSAGGNDVFVAKYNAAGVHQWSQRFGSSLGDSGFSVAADSFGNVLVTGGFHGTVNFGDANLVSAGESDIFLAKYASVASTGVGGTPKNVLLSISAYPNPFNPSTTIRYTIPLKGRVSIDVYDARGARVATLVSEEKMAGAYTQEWTGHDDAGRSVSSGVYFARVSHSSGTRRYKMVLLK